MKKRFTSPLVVSLLLILVLMSIPSATSTAQEGSLPQGQQEDRLEADEEMIVPAPKDLKEATAIYVFLGWIWLLIGILLFFLRLKIKEVDRLHDLDYFKEDKN